MLLPTHALPPALLSFFWTPGDPAAPAQPSDLAQGRPPPSRPALDPPARSPGSPAQRLATLPQVCADRPGARQGGGDHRGCRARLPPPAARRPARVRLLADSPPPAPLPAGSRPAW